MIWATFWVPTSIKTSKKTYICWGSYIVNDKISSVLVEQADGSRVYIDEPELIAAAEPTLNITKKRRKR